MYFVAIVLPKELDEKILVYKKQMHESYGCKVGLKSPAHITLVPPFWTKVEKEEALKADIENIASPAKPFALTTNNFSAFKQRTLFIATKESKSLDALKQAVDKHFSAKDYKIKKDTRPFHPHITIATRDLHKAAFAEAWQDFQNKKFEEEFEAEELSLLKHNGQTWDVIFKASFDNRL